MIKYYHASLGLHTKTTLIAAAKSGYLRECPGLEAKAISKYIAVEDTAEMGHMKHIPKGVKSTTTKSRRGRPAKLMQPSELTEAIEDSTSTPTQEPSNDKIHLVFISVQKAEGYIASNQT